MSGLPPGEIKLIRYAAGAGGYNSSVGTTHGGSFNGNGLGQTRICCGPKVDVGTQPCGPERCPIKATVSKGGILKHLPAAPFFAALDAETGRCSCFAPQSCDDTGGE